MVIIVNRIAEIIIKCRNNSITSEEQIELDLWVVQHDDHMPLLQQLKDDDYLCSECAKMRAGNQASNWKKIKKHIFSAITNPHQEKQLCETYYSPNQEYDTINR